jgi:hypothetical protein
VLEFGCFGLGFCSPLSGIHHPLTALPPCGQAASLSDLKNLVDVRRTYYHLPTLDLTVYEYEQHPSPGTSTQRGHLLLVVAARQAIRGYLLLLATTIHHTSTPGNGMCSSVRNSEAIKLSTIAAPDARTSFE